MDKLELYLDRVCRSIGGPRSLRQHIRQELREHLLDAMAEHKAAGLPEEAALDRALEDFGGPEQVRSELEATHGHRLLPLVIDRAMQWKERTMRAKWLWTTWTYLVVVGVLAMQVFYFTFAQMMYVPKLRKIQGDGWLGMDSVNLPVTAWLDSLLRGLEWLGNHATACLLIAAGMWGLFEWRVRSENKAFIRLSVLGTAALGMMVGVFFVTGALVIPFELGLPAMVQIATPFVNEQMETIDASIRAIEQARDKKDWAAVGDNAERASSAVDRLSTVAGALPTPARQGKPTVDELRAWLKSAHEHLLEAQKANRDKDAGRLDEAMKNFRQVYGQVREATKPVKKAG
jgi:hypothetical protein